MLHEVLFFIYISTILTQEILERNHGECYTNVCSKKENERLKKQNDELQRKVHDLNDTIRDKDKILSDLRRTYVSSACSSSSAVTTTTTSTLSISTEQARQCPDSRWEAFLNSCYFVGSNALAWSNASESCNTMNSSLASVTTPEKNEYLIFLAKTKGVSNSDGYWLDGTDYLREGLWFWNSSGICITYQNWGSGEPNNMHEGEHCLEIKTTKNYTWNDEKCTSSTRQYICEMIL